MQQYKFRILSDLDIPQIIALRKSAFQTYYKDAVDLSGLEWIRMDAASVHLGIFKGADLVSCLRVSVFASLKKLEAATQFKTPAEFQPPLALLARAATRDDCLSLGFHSVLRYAALEICKQNNIQVVLGSLEERSLRKSQLLDLGYEIVSRITEWKDSYIKNEGDVILVALRNPDKINLAIDKLKTSSGFLHLAEPIQKDELNVKIQTWI